MLQQNRSAIGRLIGVISVPFFFLFLFSCGSNPHPGFTCTDSGTYFKLHSFGDNARMLKPGDVVLVDVSEYDSSGALLRQASRKYFINGNAENDAAKELPQLSGVLDDCQSMQAFKVAAGDSISIIPFQEKKVRREIKLQKILTQAEYEAEQKRIAEVGDIEENQLLKRYIAENRISAEPLANGLYVLPLSGGNGDTVRAGKTISISYKGYFLDGRQFDATAEPLEFPYSSEMQVLEGIHLALGRMREGDKSKIIIPSHFAYGEKGSSTGVVPPFTTVVYEVEVVKVK